MLVTMNEHTLAHHITQSPQLTLGLTLGVEPSMGSDKHILLPYIPQPYFAPTLSHRCKCYENDIVTVKDTISRKDWSRHAGVDG